MLPLQEARQQLHFEALGKTIRRDPPEARPLSLILRHPLSCILVFTDALVGLVAKQRILIFLDLGR